MNKHSLAKSAYESDVPYFMDVFGSGISEIMPGLDFWWGMSDCKFGLTEVAIIPFKRTFDETTVEPGTGQRTTLTVGYQVIDMALRLFTYVERETRSASKVNGEKTDSVEQNSLSVAADWTLAPKQSLNLNYKRTAAWLHNKNTTQGNGLTISYAYAL